MLGAAGDVQTIAHCRPAPQRQFPRQLLGFGVGGAVAGAGGGCQGGCASATSSLAVDGIAYMAAATLCYAGGAARSAGAGGGFQATALYLLALAL